MTSAERQYWRRKLPGKFQLLLERLGRVLVRENPHNLLEFASKYLEEKLLEEQGMELYVQRSGFISIIVFYFQYVILKTSTIVKNSGVNIWQSQSKYT